MALTKQAAMEYMGQKGKPVTAKELAIDLDSRASTASELLERMTSQGLAQRDPQRRPREYVLTEPGRKCLQNFRATENVAKAAAASDCNPTINADSEGSHASSTGTQGSGEVAALYLARHEFATRSWFRNKGDLQKQIAALESQVGPQSAKQVEQLVNLERNLLRDPVYVTALRLRMQLSLTPDVLRQTATS